MACAKLIQNVNANSHPGGAKSMGRKARVMGKHFRQLSAANKSSGWHQWPVSSWLAGWAFMNLEHCKPCQEAKDLLDWQAEEAVNTLTADVTAAADED